MDRVNVLILIPINSKTNRKMINEVTILMEDGGIATLHYTGEYMLTDYYQSRINLSKKNIYEDIYEGKAYAREWNGEKYVTDRMIHDAMHWLMPTAFDYKVVYQYHEPDHEPEPVLIREFLQKFSYNIKY